MKTLVLLILLAATFGCAYNKAKLYDPGTGKIVAVSRTFTLFDSQSSLAKLHIDSMPMTNSHGSFSPGISISGLDQASSTTNLTQTVKILIEQAAPIAAKALVP